MLFTCEHSFLSFLNFIYIQIDIKFYKYISINIFYIFFKI